MIIIISSTITSVKIVNQAKQSLEIGNRIKIYL